MSRKNEMTELNSLKHELEISISFYIKEILRNYFSITSFFNQPEAVIEAIMAGFEKRDITVEQLIGEGIVERPIELKNSVDRIKDDLRIKLRNHIYYQYLKYISALDPKKYSPSVIAEVTIQTLDEMIEDEKLTAAKLSRYAEGL